MQELICCGPLRLSKLTPDTILIYRLDTQTEHTLDSVAARIVETVWQRPRTMAYCVNELRYPLSAVSPWDSHQAATVLNELLSSGVLVRVADMLSSISLKSKDSQAEPISWLAIPTRDRPQSLLRTLRSFSSNMQQYDIRAKILISIDSQSTDGESAIRATIGDWVKASTTTIVLAGADLKADYANRLAAKTGVPLDVMQFALWGRGYRGPAISANRNAISLFTAGCRVLSADDDTLCEAARIASATSGSALRFMAHGDPADLWFFDDRPGALESTEPVDVNVLGAHAEVLGTKLGSLIRKYFNSQVDISDACQHLIQSAWLGDGRVCLTHNGIVGDSGMYSGPPTASRFLPYWMQAPNGSEFYFRFYDPRILRGFLPAGQPGGRIGPPACGTMPVAMGQTCISVTRAAGGISYSPRILNSTYQPYCHRQRRLEPWDL